MHSNYQLTITRQDVLDQFTIAEPLPETMSTAPPLSLSEGSPSGSKLQTESNIHSAKEETAFREAWHKMIIQDLEGGGSEGKGTELDAFLRQGEDDFPTKGKRKSSEKGAIVEEDPFQQAIRQAMEKLQDSDDALKVRRPILFYFRQH